MHLPHGTRRSVPLGNLKPLFLRWICQALEHMQQEKQRATSAKGWAMSRMTEAFAVENLTLFLQAAVMAKDGTLFANVTGKKKAEKADAIMAGGRNPNPNPNLQL